MKQYVLTLFVFALMAIYHGAYSENDKEKYREYFHYCYDTIKITSNVEASINDSIRLQDGMRGYYYSPIIRVKEHCNVIIMFIEMNEEEIEKAMNLLLYSPTIMGIDFYKCNIKKIPDITIMQFFPTLKYITFIECDSIASIKSLRHYDFIDLSFINCRIKHLPEGIQDSYYVCNLTLDFPDDFEGFDANKELKKFNNRNLTRLKISYPKLSEFPESVFNFDQLRILSINKSLIKHIPDKFHHFKILRYIYIDVDTNVTIPKTLFYNDTVRLNSLENLYIGPHYFEYQRNRSFE